MPRSRTRWILLALAALAVLVPSVWTMVQRIAAFYQAAERPMYVFSRVGVRAFTYAGRPAVIDDIAHPLGVGGEGVRLRYGDEELELPATVEPGFAELPGLARHEDWLQVFRFADRAGLSSEAFEHALEEGRVRDRLVIVTRRPRSGPDPRSGHVWRRDWTFEFHELLPDGSIRTERLHYPTNRPGREPKPGELQPDTWQMQAALMLMPPSARPARSFTDDAIAAMGWTLPVASAAALVLTLAIAFIVAPARRSAPAPEAR